MAGVILPGGGTTSHSSIGMGGSPELNDGVGIDGRVSIPVR